MVRMDYSILPKMMDIRIIHLNISEKKKALLFVCHNCKLQNKTETQQNESAQKTNARRAWFVIKQAFFMNVNWYEQV